MSADTVSERQAQSGAGRFDLRNAVLEATLGLTAGHEEISLTKLEDARPPASSWPQKELAWLAQGHHSHDGVSNLARDPVSMPGHAVCAVSVEVDPHGVEPNAIAPGQRRTSVLKPRGRAEFLVIEFLPGREPRFIDLAVVHPPTPLAPRNVTKQLLESSVRSGHPARAMVHPALPVQRGSLEAPERRVGARALVCPQRGLPCGNR